MIGSVPTIRIRLLNDAPVNNTGRYVLYWMIACRRSTWNFGLQHAGEWARKLNKPLVILEPLRCDYRWASDRLHGFILDGMADNAQRFAAAPALYHPYVEPERDAGKGLLVELSREAGLVVTDEFPVFMMPHMVRAAVRQLSVRLEQVDSNGLLPLRAAEQVFTSAYSFRRFLQKQLHPHLQAFPKPDPLGDLMLPHLEELPREITRRWPAATVKLLAGDRAALAALPIDHAVSTVPTKGSTTAAEVLLEQFITSRMARYHEARNLPEADATSGLSPYLHFGHLAAHQIFDCVMSDEQWSPAEPAGKPTGSRTGWWGVSEGAEAFLDQLITWRELGFNMCSKWEHFDQYQSLPDWARQTLAQHANDPRPYVYRLEEFAAGETHDPLWNAAQMQLVREGRIHNYLRMLWGKKILEWSRTPQEALTTMIELNNKYALDGRDPNSYSGIFWILGRYDRPWGPERRIFGKVRYMSSQNTARKLPVQDYINWYAP
jgi:deoxyribodipyrimidine photo-lyase